MRVSRAGRGEQVPKTTSQSPSFDKIVRFAVAVRIVAGSFGKPLAIWVPAGRLLELPGACADRMGFRRLHVWQVGSVGMRSHPNAPVAYIPLSGDTWAHRRAFIV